MARDERSALGCGSVAETVFANSLGPEEEVGLDEDDTDRPAEVHGDDTRERNVAQLQRIRRARKRVTSSKMLGGASQTVSKIRVKCNGT